MPDGDCEGRMNPWREGFLDGLRPEEPLTVDEWSDRYRRLSSKASAEPGPWRTDRTPYLRQVMRDLSSESSVQRVVLMFSAQSGKTEVGLNWLAWIIDHSPGPLLAVQPTIEMARRMSKQRLEGLIEDTPRLKEKIAPARSRDGSNSMFAKDFPGGILLLTGANSPSQLRSAPCRYLFMDEVDAMQEIPGEGDPVALAERRTTTFARRKVLLTSTPTVKDFSKIEAEYMKSDQRKFWVPAPCCGEFQHLEWSRLKWEKDRPETAQYQCKHCGERFDEHHKTQMLAAGEWRNHSHFDGKTAGFHLNGLYSPLGWASWSELAEDFLRAKNDPAALRTFINTRLAETYEENYSAQVSAEGLMGRRLPYEPGTVPKDVVLLTGGVDVQLDRLEISVWGWSGAKGQPETGWLVWHQKLMGDPTQPEVWKQLDAVLASEWETEEHHHLKIAQLAVDTGYCTHEVYAYVRERLPRGVVAIKGSSRRNAAAVGKGSKVDVNWKGRTIKKGVTLYMLGTDTIKTTLFGKLRLENGPGNLNFGLAADTEYFQQLTSERQKLVYRGGMPTRIWVRKATARAECLDCAVYAYAAFQLYIRRLPKLTMWENLREKLESGDNRPLKSRTKPSKPAQSFVNSW